MNFEVVAFWSKKTRDGMVCLKENNQIIDSKIAPKNTSEKEFLLWRRWETYNFINLYKLNKVKIRLVNDINVIL